MSRRARAFSLARELKHADSECYGEPVDVDALVARVGDTVACDVRQPVAATISATLETPAAVEYANRLLQDKGSGWRRDGRAAAGEVVLMIPLCPSREVHAPFEAHATVLITAPAIQGCMSFEVSLPEFTSHRGSVLDLCASKLGVSLDQYRRWYECQGRVQCVARTRRKLQCRCAVPGVQIFDPAAWVKVDAAGGYCFTHAQESA